MTCVCSMAGTSACASCFWNQNGTRQANNFMTWNTRAETSYKDALILLDELGLSERTCENVSDSGFLCSACSFGDFDGFHGYQPNYCPNCGAKVANDTLEREKVVTPEERKVTPITYHYDAKVVDE